MDKYFSNRDGSLVLTLAGWRLEWEEAENAGRLSACGWPDDFDAFCKRCLIECDVTASGAILVRKRKRGAGRKPKPDKLIIRQVCLAREQAEAVRLAASEAGISQSAWIREAVTARLVS